jgi:serine protease Do
MPLPLLFLCSLLLSRAAVPAPAPSAAQVLPFDASFADLVARVAPCTVYIQAAKGDAMTSGIQQLTQDYALPQPGRGPVTNTSTGSGVMIRSDGLVLTNHHVVAGATSVFVTLYDKRQYVADVVGSDARTDIALLRLKGAGPFTTATFGNSDSLRVGEWVLAVGHPFDFQFTVTAGIVSARGRRNLARDEIQDYIQTDAAVNPGSSGGPLFDMKGDVVGINTAIFSPSNGLAQSAGISFAIPINMARWVTNELLATGRVPRPGIGVTTADSPATPADPRPGAEIARVVADGPAETAGLRRGDVIVAVDGEAIGNSEDLRGLVLARGVDSELKITVERGADVRTVSVVTWDDERVGEADEAIPVDAREWGGMVLANATAERRAKFGVAMPGHQDGGVIVLAVQNGSPAATAGLLRGDLVMEVQRQNVKDLEQFLDLVHGKRSALLLFWRGDGANYAAVGGVQ